MMDLSQTNNQPIEILVELLDEGTEVWRPTKAVQTEGNLFKLLPTVHYDSEDEIWAFAPNSVIRLEEKILGDGKKHLIATHPDEKAKRVHVESSEGLQTTYALEIDNGLYKILKNRSLSDTSCWKFPPDSIVSLTTKKLAGGKFTLATSVR